MTVGERRSCEPRLAGRRQRLLRDLRSRMAQGDPETALARRSRGADRKHGAPVFRRRGRARPTPCRLSTDLDLPLVVTGVVEDLPGQHAPAVRSVALADVLGPRRRWRRGAATAITPTRASQTAPIRPRSAAGSGEFFEQRFSDGSGQIRGFTAMPIRDIHLRSTREGELRTPGSIATVYAFGAIAVFVLLIACINFVNLATARATQRAKEVGLRKAVGGTQSAADRAVHRRVAAARRPSPSRSRSRLSLRRCRRSRPSSNETSASTTSRRRKSLAAIVALTLLVGVGGRQLSRVLLSAFNPVRALARRGHARQRRRRRFARCSSFVQFSISIALVVATLVVFEQQRFASDVGARLPQGPDRRADRIAGWRPGPAVGVHEAPARELPGVEAVTASNVVPGTSQRRPNAGQESHATPTMAAS